MPVINPSSAAGDHSVKVTTGNGHGSTNTKVRRFTTVPSSSGSAITYVDSAVNGATFTINADGLYEIVYLDQASAGTSYLGVSKNSAQLTTDIYSITAADRLGMAGFGGAVPLSLTFIEKLSAGDVIRPHTNGVPDATISYYTMFKIRKVG